jgi:hypothetical protein
MQIPGTVPVYTPPRRRSSRMPLPPRGAARAAGCVGLGLGRRGVSSLSPATGAETVENRHVRRGDARAVCGRNGRAAQPTGRVDWDRWRASWRPVRAFGATPDAVCMNSMIEYGPTRKHHPPDGLANSTKVVPGESGDRRFAGKGSMRALSRWVHRGKASARSRDDWNGRA